MRIQRFASGSPSMHAGPSTSRYLGGLAQRRLVDMDRNAQSSPAPA